MKIKSIFAFTIAALMLSACGNDEDHQGPENPNGGVAYLAMNVVTESAPRAAGDSEENAGETAESEIKSLYLLTFDASKQLLGVPGTSVHYLQIPGTPAEAQRVSADAKYLLVIANPGTKLLAAITGSSVGTTYALLNAKISNVDESEIVDTTEGFAMISSGDEGTSPQPNDVIAEGLQDISNNIVRIADYPTPQQAQNAAMDAAKKASVKIERLAAKVEVKTAATVAVPSGAEPFNFIGWTLDATNTEFYPFAKKTILAVSHTSTLGSYISNFYTEDPNFTPNPVGEGLAFVKISSAYEPEFPLGTSVTWNATTAKEYRIENTMAAAEQKYGNATRVVIKGNYYPTAGWSGDWFNFAGVNYENLADLKTAYTAAGPGSNLQAACDRMYDDIKAFDGTIIGTDFLSLTTGDLAQQSPVGGEIIKSTTKDAQGNIIPCIRWYQGGLNYYYYEIRHDNSATAGTMAFAKYGIVRNNWYELTLTKVTGAGTPWYPDPNNPGPGDPDGPDPIDEDGAYLGIDLKVAPWILWKTDFEI